MINTPRATDRHKLHNFRVSMSDPAEPKACTAPAKDEKGFETGFRMAPAGSRPSLLEEIFAQARRNASRGLCTFAEAAALEAHMVGVHGKPSATGPDEAECAAHAQKCAAAGPVFAELCEKAAGLDPIPLRVEPVANSSCKFNVFLKDKKICIENQDWRFFGRNELGSETQDYIRTEWEAARYLALLFVALCQCGLVEASERWMLPWYLPEDVDMVLSEEHPPADEDIHSDARWVFAAQHKTFTSGVKLYRAACMPSNMFDVESYHTIERVVRMSPTSAWQALPFERTESARTSRSDETGMPHSRRVYVADWFANLTTPPRPAVFMPAVAEPAVSGLAAVPKPPPPPPSVYFPFHQQPPPDLELEPWMAHLAYAQDRPLRFEWRDNVGEVVSSIDEEWLDTMPPLIRYVFFDRQHCPKGICINRFDRETFEVVAKALGAPDAESVIRGVKHPLLPLFSHVRWPRPAPAGIITVGNLRPCSEWMFEMLGKWLPNNEATEELQTDSRAFPRNFSRSEPVNWSALSDDRKTITVEMHTKLRVASTPRVHAAKEGQFFRDDWHGLVLPFAEYTQEYQAVFVTLYAPEGYKFEV